MGAVSIVTMSAWKLLALFGYAALWAYVARGTSTRATGRRG